MPDMQDKFDRFMAKYDTCLSNIKNNVSTITSEVNVLKNEVSHHQNNIESQWIDIKALQKDTSDNTRKIDKNNAKLAAWGSMAGILIAVATKLIDKLF